MLEALLTSAGTCARHEDLLRPSYGRAEKSKPPAPPPVDWMALTQSFVRAGLEIRTAIKESEASAAERRSRQQSSPQQPGGNVQVTVMNVRWA